MRAFWICSSALIVALALAVGASAAGKVAYHELTAGSRASNLRGEQMQAVGRVLRSRTAAVRALRGFGLDTTAAKNVNFTRKSLIVALAEYQPSGGWRARVSHVAVDGREAVVTLGVRYEGGDVAVSDIERPWVVVAVDRDDVAGVRSTARIRRR